MPDLPDPVRMRQLLAWCGNNLMDSSDPKKDKKQSKADSIGEWFGREVGGEQWPNNDPDLSLYIYQLMKYRKGYWGN